MGQGLHGSTNFDSNINATNNTFKKVGDKQKWRIYI